MDGGDGQPGMGARQSVVVVGATGATGRHVCAQLLQRGHRCTVGRRPPPPPVPRRPRRLTHPPGRHAGGGALKGAPGGCPGGGAARPESEAGPRGGPRLAAGPLERGARGARRGRRRRRPMPGSQPHLPGPVAAPVPPRQDSVRAAHRGRGRVGEAPGEVRADGVRRRRPPWRRRRSPLSGRTRAPRRDAGAPAAGAGQRGGGGVHARPRHEVRPGVDGPAPHRHEEWRGPAVHAVRGHTLPVAAADADTRTPTRPRSAATRSRWADCSATA